MLWPLWKYNAASNSFVTDDENNLLLQTLTGRPLGCWDNSSAPQVVTGSAATGCQLPASLLF